MIKKVLIIFSLCLICLTEINLAAELKLPQMPTVEAIQAQFKSPGEITTFLQTNKTSQAIFFAGMAYFYYAVNLIYYQNSDQNFQKNCTQQATELFEKCVNLNPNNSLYLAMLGSIKGLNCQYLNFPIILYESQKVIDILNQAVLNDKNNPEINLIRFRVFVNYPYYFYPLLKNTILEDYNLIQNWIKIFKENFAANPDLIKNSSFFNSIENESFYLIGKYYYNELHEKDPAKQYFEKINQDSFYFKEAKTILEK